MNPRSICLALVISAALLTACAAPSGAPAPGGGSLGADRAGAAATLAAAQAQQQQVIARIAQATEQAQATRDAYAFEATATTGALAVAEAQLAATATAGAMSVQATQTAQEWAAVSTERAQERRATAQAVEAAATLEAAATVRSERLADIYAALLALLLLAFGLAAVFLLHQGVSQWLDGIDRRRALVETRVGTVLLVAGAGGPVARVLSRPDLASAFLPEADDFDHTDAPAVEAESIPIQRHGRTVSHLARDWPDPSTLDDRRRLVLRLLRAGMSQAGPDAAQLPGYRDLGWPSETWTKAVSLLKPHVTTRPGRNGGTFLEDPNYPTLHALYVAVGERRLAPLPHERPSTVAANVSPHETNRTETYTAPVRGV